MTGQAVWITADFVNPPKKNPKYGSIKTREEGYISVPVGELGQFRKGGRYCVEIAMNGDFKNFVRFANTPPSQPAAPPPTNGYAAQRGVGGGYAAPASQRQPTPQRPAPAPVSRPAEQTFQPFPSSFDPQSLSIFVTGIVGRALGSGHFLASDIDELTKEARAAFLKHMAGIEPPAQEQTKVSPPNAYVDPELNDEIPGWDEPQADNRGDPIPY